MVTTGELVRMAIVSECSAPKLGNVYPGVEFSDLSYEMFCDVASAMGKTIDSMASTDGIGGMFKRDPGGGASQPTAAVSTAAVCGVGDYCLAMTQSMMKAAGTNTSLGTILLLAPLIVSKERKIPVAKVLEQMTPRDSELVYRAIREANPGGMGRTEEMDVAGPAPQSLMDAMQLASKHDDIALQFVTDFELVDRYSQRLCELTSQQSKLQTSRVPQHQQSILTQDHLVGLEGAVQRLQVEILSERFDSLIVRKSGETIAEKVREECRELKKRMDAGQSWASKWREVDGWMRRQRSESGKQLANPGTTADLIAVSIFTLLQNRIS